MSTKCQFRPSNNQARRKTVRGTDKCAFQFMNVSSMKRAFEVNLRMISFTRKGILIQRERKSACMYIYRQLLARAFNER